jgi:hypothetical protein
MRTKNSIKKFSIKINGEAFSKDTTNLDNVKTFDDFVNALFDRYKEKLLKEFEKEKELSYIKPTKNETDKLVDPYLYDFRFDSVTKDIEAGS